MEYQVPQFIEVEDKLIGPLTFKQFVYLAGAAGLSVVFFVYLPIIFSLLLSGLIVALAVALSFYKVNGKSFIDVLEAGFNYYTGARFFLWKHKDPTMQQQSATAAAAQAAEDAARPIKATPRLTSGKLSELAWSLDVKRPDSDIDMDDK
jgi:hypothetical protein